MAESMARRLAPFATQACSIYSSASRRAVCHARKLAARPNFEKRAKYALHYLVFAIFFRSDLASSFSAMVPLALSTILIIFSISKLMFCTLPWPPI